SRIIFSFLKISFGLINFSLNQMDSAKHPPAGFFIIFDTCFLSDVQSFQTVLLRLSELSDVEINSAQQTKHPLKTLFAINLPENCHCFFKVKNCLLKQTLQRIIQTYVR